MHWRAIRRSIRPREDHSLQVYPATSAAPKTTHLQEDDIQRSERNMAFPFGHDDAADVRPEPRSSTALDEAEMNIPVYDEHDELSVDSDDDQYFQVSIPTFSKGVTTFAYQLALHNRIKNGKLTRHGEWSMAVYKPTFIHDCLMQPGSLGALIGKMSPQIIPKMTPALLPGYHPYVHADTQLPCILQSPNNKDYVQGMVIFGQGKTARKLIHVHYRANTRRVKIPVEVDVAVPVPPHERRYPLEHWRLKRRTIKAHAWIWSNVGSGDVQFRTQVPRWTLEDYVSGDLGPSQALRVAERGYLEEEVSVVESEDEVWEEVREVLRGGAGHLDYGREAGFTGW